jgi:hypothetical protein
VLTGRLDATQDAVAIRAVVGDEVATAAQVRSDGSFTLGVPAGESYRLEVLTRSGGVKQLAARDGTRLVGVTFRVCAPVEPFDFGPMGGGGSSGDPGPGGGGSSGDPGPGGGGGGSPGNPGCDDPPPPPWPCTDPADPDCPQQPPPCGPNEPGCDDPPPPPCDPADPNCPTPWPCMDPADPNCPPPPQCDPADPNCPTEPPPPPWPCKDPADPGCAPPCDDPTNPESCQDPCWDDPMSCGCKPNDPYCWGEPPMCGPEGCQPAHAVVVDRVPADFGCGGLDTP